MQSDAINAAIGAKAADFRRVHGWSQTELADRLGQALGKSVDPTTITRLEQGRRPIPVHELIALSRLFGVEPAVFMKFIGPLDDVIGAMEFQAEGLDAKAQVAAYEAQAATQQLACLCSLATYRAGRDVHDLVTGLGFLHTLPRFDRSDWRAILLDAGVSAEALDETTAAVEGAPGSDPQGAARSEFVAALAARVTGAARVLADG